MEHTVEKLSSNKVKISFKAPAADFEEAGNEDVVRKLAADLDGKIGPDEIRAKLAATLPVAKAQLMAEL